MGTADCGAGCRGGRTGSGGTAHVAGVPHAVTRRVTRVGGVGEGRAQQRRPPQATAPTLPAGRVMAVTTRGTEGVSGPQTTRPRHGQPGADSSEQHKENQGGETPGQQPPPRRGRLALSADADPRQP